MRRKIAVRMTATLVLLPLIIMTAVPVTSLGQEEIEVAVVARDLDQLPPVYVKVPATKEQLAAGKATHGFVMLAKKQEVVNLLKEIEEKEGATHQTDPATRAMYVVGGVDLGTYWFIEIDLPWALRDADGGTIRLIMQHETDGSDQVRIIDEHIGTEYHNDDYGRRGRSWGRYGWTRQSGGGDKAWILGDNVAHNLADPWGWAWITDYRWLQGNGVLPIDRIRIYSHPHVTTRVIIKD